MGVIVVEVVSPVTVDSTTVTNRAAVVEVLSGSTSPIETVSGQSVVDVVRPGGTVVNVQYGDTLPPNPTEGQVFILTT